MIDARGDEIELGVRPPGHRLPETAHVGRVRLQVSDLDRSIAYYETVIGFSTLHLEAGRAELGPHGGNSVLVELREKRGAKRVERRGHLGLYHFAILLPERAALGRFVSHLASLGVYAGMSDHLVSEAVYLTDPDGLGIEVYADRPRDTWRSHDRQLAMATDPLDVQDLVASARGEAWTGMPNGTVIGHVHLHVADLGEAERFYHAGLGFDKIVWSYPGALFLSAGGYHHHLGTNTWAADSPAAAEDDARLIDWEVVLPDRAAVDATAASMSHTGFAVQREHGDLVARDPWGTTVRVVADSASAR